jgi:ankyrin repeat protein
MDHYCDLPEQSLTAIIALPNTDPDKLKLIDFINSLAGYEFAHEKVRTLITRLIHFVAKSQQDDLFWLIFSIAQRAQNFNITHQKNKLGDCLIHTILRHAHTPNLLEGLLSHDPSLIQQFNHFQETPLHVFLTTLAFHPEFREKIGAKLSPFLESLIQGNNLLAYNKTGYSPLHLCAFYGLDKELDFILTHFPTLIDYPTTKNNPCLLIAAKQGHVNIIEILIKHQANLQAKTNKQHNTALHIAGQKGHEIICEKLLQAGIIPVKNKIGLTPLDFAKQNHHHESFAVLLKHENERLLKEYHEEYHHAFTPLFSKVSEFSPEELTLNRFLMGISLGYELAYQKIPEGKLVAIKNEFNQTQLYYARQLYDTAGLISHVFLPHNPNLDANTEIYITFQGTNNTDALHRDVEHKGPGYQSYKQKESDLISRFFKILTPLLNSHPGKISLTIAGHSLGGGDSFYFLQSLLKTIAKHLPMTFTAPLQMENLISDKTLSASDDVAGIINETEKLLLQKLLIPYDPNILKINRLRVMALNPVGLPKSTDHALEGLARYLGHNLSLETFILRSDGDFAQRMGDRVPLCAIPTQYATVNLLLAPGDNFAIQKASALYFGAASINPRDTQTSMLNIGTDMAALGAVGGIALGPFGLLLGLAAGGARLYASDMLKQWGRHMIWKPHTTLLPDASSEQDKITDLLEKVKLLSNTNPEHRPLIQEVGHNLSATAFERFMTQTSKNQLTEKLKALSLK